MTRNDESVSEPPPTEPGPTTVTRHDWSVDDPAHAVVQACADDTDTDPLDLPPLADAVDTDALNALFRSTTDATVTFDYADRAVTVTATGRVVVGEPD